MFKTILLVLALIIIGLCSLSSKHKSNPSVLPLPTPVASFTPTSTPTPKPLTFSEMNQLYGPCIYLPVLLYHHVQDTNVAKENQQTSISVSTAIFRNQMSYLSSRGYRTTSPAEIIGFFDSGVAIPPKSLLITFDDGYQDLYTTAWPILREFGFRALVFLPTGLMNNYGYLNWSEVAELASAGNYFANHTWSHKSTLQKVEVVEREIVLADNQLSERALNNPKVFAYPYGSASSGAEKYLASLSYKLAFTTRYGSTLCQKQRFTLPRMRIGNSSLLVYGL